MGRFVDLTLNGVTTGMIFSAVALALVLIWRATRILNFAQGAMAMFTTFLAWTVQQHGGSYWLALVVAVVAGLVIGAVAERGVVRWVEQRPPLNAVIVTLGLLVLLEATAGLVWGGSIHGYPPPFSQVGLKVGGRHIGFSPFDAFILGTVVVVLVLLVALFRFTALGLRMRASAFAAEVARLLGVRVGRMLTLGWALATAVGAVAGVLFASKGFVSPNFMDAVFIYGFTAAVIGGLDSPVGAVVGGLGTGLVLSYVGGYLGSNLEDFGALVVLLVVLMARPQGIFAPIEERRV